MRATRRSTLSNLLATASTTATIALLAAFPATNPLVAQAQVQAYYPLLTDLLDATNTYGPVLLNGNPAPLPPNNGVCVNGIYLYNAGGQDVRTPMLPTLNTADFEINVEFQIAGLPTNTGPVIMGGNLWRWLGIYLDSIGTVGIKHNNSNLAWSSTTLTTGLWYAASLKYEAGTVALFVNGALALQANVGTLIDGGNKNITTNDFSNGLSFNGCIRQLMIVNDTSILATAAPYGAGCPGSAGVPALSASNSPQIGTTFFLDATNLPTGPGLAFLLIGFSQTTSPLGPLPFNLQAFGLGATCDLWSSAEATLLFPVAGGAGNSSLAVPADPGLTGVALYFQCASIDGGATGGLALSNGVAASIGL